jgi:hypothetical protein
VRIHGEGPHGNEEEDHGLAGVGWGDKEHMMTSKPSEQCLILMLIGRLFRGEDSIINYFTDFQLTRIKPPQGVPNFITTDTFECATWDERLAHRCDGR